ncbi:MAG: hypothetical protein IPM84_12150 [Anaerolineae bacterium]|nr:hypothetical protein [Anaerolineae bacterium]
MLNDGVIQKINKRMGRMEIAQVAVIVAPWSAGRFGWRRAMMMVGFERPDQGGMGAVYTAWDMAPFAADLWADADEALRAKLEEQHEAWLKATGGHPWNPPDWAGGDACPAPFAPAKWDAVAAHSCAPSLTPTTPGSMA